MRIRHAAFPALKTLEDFDWSAQRSAEKPLVLHLPSSPGSRSERTSALRPARHRQEPLRDRARDQSLRKRLPRRVRDRAGTGLLARGRAGPQPTRGRAQAVSSATTSWSSTRSATCRSNGRPRISSSRSSPAATSAVDHRHQQPRLRVMGRDPRRRRGRCRPDRPARPPRHHDHPQGQELPTARAGPRRRARRAGSVAPRLHLSGDSPELDTNRPFRAGAREIDTTGAPLTPSEHAALPPTRPQVVHFSTAETGPVLGCA